MALPPPIITTGFYDPGAHIFYMSARIENAGVDGTFVIAGICWGTSPDPTIDTDQVTDGGTIEPPLEPWYFPWDIWVECEMYEIEPETQYYARPFVYNDSFYDEEMGIHYENVTYGEVVAWTPPAPGLTNRSVMSVDAELLPPVLVTGAELVQRQWLDAEASTPAVLACEMTNANELDAEPEVQAGKNTTGASLVNRARMKARPLLDNTVLPPTDDLGWTEPDVEHSPLWDIVVTLGAHEVDGVVTGGRKVPLAAISVLQVELDKNGGFESCTLVFYSNRVALWRRRMTIFIEYGDDFRIFEGRLNRQRRNIGPELGWTLEFVGELNDLRNHRAFRRVYADSLLTNWKTDQPLGGYNQFADDTGGGGD